MTPPSDQVRMYHPDLDTEVDVPRKTVSIRMGKGWVVAKDDEISPPGEQTPPPTSGDAETPASDEEIK